MTSCHTTIKQTATTRTPGIYLNVAATADFVVSEKKIVFVYEPTRAVRRGGTENVIKTAISEALRANGGGDVLVGLEYTTQSKPSGLGISPIRKITISGYPATYTSFRTLNDDIWSPIEPLPSTSPIR